MRFTYWKIGIRKKSSIINTNKTKWNKLICKSRKLKGIKNYKIRKWNKIIKFEIWKIIKSVKPIFYITF